VRKIIYWPIDQIHQNDHRQNLRPLRQLFR